MPAQRYFHGRREPSNAAVTSVVGWIEERRLGEVHLQRDGLHLGGVERVVHDAHGGGIALEWHVRERVDLLEADALGPHCPVSGWFERTMAPWYCYHAGPVHLKG